jgi:hypothetical protein
MYNYFFCKRKKYLVRRRRVVLFIFTKKFQKKEVIQAGLCVGPDKMDQAGWSGLLGSTMLGLRIFFFFFFSSNFS